MVAHPEILTPARNQRSPFFFLSISPAVFSCSCKAATPPLSSVLATHVDISFPLFTYPVLNGSKAQSGPLLIRTYLADVGFPLVGIGFPPLCEL